MLDFLRGGRRRRRQSALKLYAAAVTQARQPRFYADLGVDDSVDGRFDMIALHCFLIMRKLKDERAPSLSQALFDVMFDDMDQNLREMGASDLSVGGKVKTMAKAFMGRVGAYEAALNDRLDLEAVIARNLFRGRDADVAGVPAIARYVVAQAAHLASLPLSAIEAGDVTFLPVDLE